MSNELKKLAVYDDRVIQSAPEYAVYKGGESVTAQKFKAISYNASQVNFNVVVPSPNIFVDRGVDWYGRVQLVLTATAVLGGTDPRNNPIIAPGRDFALSAFPLHQMTSTMTASINDVVVSMNTAELLPQILRMTDYKANLKQRTCPSFLDTFLSYDSAYGTFSNPLSSYFDAVQGNYVPNGGYHRLLFINPVTGNVLAGNGNYTYNGVQVWFTNGIPTCDNGAGAANPNLGAGVPIGIQFESTEKLILPPFLFADSKEQTTGLFGIGAFQVVCNMGSNAVLQRVIRQTSATNREITAVSYLGNGWMDASLNVEFLTPSLSIPLPPVSSIPWMEFPRYTSQFTIAANQANAVISSNNFVLSCVPDYFMIFAKPQLGVYGATDADWLFPITGISLNFNNFSGLMSTYTIEQLYHMSVQNGLETDFQVFSGYATIATQYTAGAGGSIGPYSVNLVGAPLIIKPGKDFALSQGLAPGVNGNFNLQMNLTLTNPTAAAYNNNALIYLVAINSGYFESHGGSSRIVKAPLSEADVINATGAHQLGASRMGRLVGGGFFEKVGSMVNKASHLHHLEKQPKSRLPDSKVKPILGMVNNGKRQAGTAGPMAERIINQ